MYHFYADDGRILTPPNELEPQLKGAFLAFSKLLGHIRFFYVTDEIWDGKSSLIFRADSEQLAAIALGDGVFHVQIADEDFRIADETQLDTVFEALKKAPPSLHRPFEQRTLEPNGCPCGRHCELCLGSKECDENNLSAGDNFGYMNWACYHGCLGDLEIERYDGVFQCPGCEEIRTTKGVWEDWDGCKYYACLMEKGYANCAECGEYHSCDVFRDSHPPGQCNLGITAEEVTKLVIPYAMKERLDVFCKGKAAL